MSKTGETDEDVKGRINKARQATLRPAWRSKNLSCDTKLRLFISNVKPVLQYGAETWRQTKNSDHKLQVFINTCLRQIMRIRWPERISNQELLRKIGQEPIKVTIQNGKWKWIGHTLHRDQTCIPPSLGLEPSGEAEKRKTSPDMEKNSASRA